MDSVADSGSSNVHGTGLDGRGRDSLFLLARIKFADEAAEKTVRVRNLSSGGVMAELPEPVAPDAVVHIELRGLGWLTGRVAWQTEGRAGIAFDKPVDPQLARKPVGVGKAGEHNYRPMRYPT